MASSTGTQRTRRFLAFTFITAVALFGGCGGSEPAPPAAPTALDPRLQSPERVGMLTSTSGGNFVLPWEGTFGGTLGDVFNSVSEAVVQRSCIDFDTDSGTGSVGSDFEFDVFDSIEDLALSMDATYSTNSNYGIYKNSLTASVMSKLSLSSNTIYAHARHRVTGRSTSLKNVRLKDEYKSMAPRDVISKCGDYYLGNFSNGAALDAILTITASSLNEKISIKTDLSQKIARTKADISTRSDLARYVADNKASIHIISRGCTAISVQEPTLDAFYKASDEFYTSVNACLADPAKGSLTDQMTFYSLEPYIDGIDGSLEANRKARDDLLFARTEYMKLTSDVNDILADQTDHLLYDWSDKTKYDVQGLTGVIAAIGSEDKRSGLLGTRIKDAIAVCESSAFGCVFPPIDEQYTYGTIRAKLPAHKDFYPGSCSEIYRSNQSVSSGPHYIYLGNNSARKLSVYCVFGTGGQLDYLELKDFDDVSSPKDPRFFQPDSLTDSHNYAQSIGQFQTSNPRQDWPDVVTSYRKFRIIPRQTTVEVLLGDFSFATSYTNPTDPTRIPNPRGTPAWQYHVPVGYAQGGITAYGGYSGKNAYVAFDVAEDTWRDRTSVTGWPGSGWGRARIDVSNHPLRISNGTQWQAMGVDAQGFTTFGKGRQTVDIYGRGLMGGNFPVIVDGVASRYGIELEYVAQ